LPLGIKTFFYHLNKTYYKKSGQVVPVMKMVYMKIVCDPEQCCQMSVDSDSGMESVVSCTKNWPLTRLD